MATIRRTGNGEIKTCGSCCFGIDIQLVPTKVAFFVLKASQGTFFLYINAFLVSVGLTVTEAGFISAIAYIIASIAGPIWGMLADYTGYRRLIYVILCMGVASSIFSLPWVAKEIKFITCIKYGVGIVNMTNNTLEYTFNVSTSVPGKCNLKLIPFASSMFYAMSSILFVAFIFLLPLKGYFDSIVMNILKNMGMKSNFGEQRMFGSLGYGVGNLIAGVAAGYYYDTTMSKYAPIFYIYLPLILVMIPLGIFMFSKTNWEAETTCLSQSNNFLGEAKKKTKLRHLRETFGKIGTVFFMLSVLIAGIIRSIALSFLFLTMSDVMDTPKSAMGLAMFISGLSEFVMFPFTKKFINSLGLKICMELGILAWIIRLLMMSYLKNPWLVAIPQALQSFSFALFVAAYIEYTHIISPAEIYVTMFSITYSLYYGVSGFLGNMVGGILYEKYGGPVLFQGTVVAAGIWLFVMFAYFHGIGFIKSTRRYNQLPAT